MSGLSREYSEKEVDEFASLLEEAGYEEAIHLINDSLVPFARSEVVSLWKAAWLYANQDEEQDTSWFQLFHALQEISPSEVRRININ